MSENPLDVQAILDAQTVEATTETNRSKVQARAATALDDLQTLLGTDNTVINAGPAPYIKLLARAVRLLIRLALRRFDGTD